MRPPALQAIAWLLLALPPFAARAESEVERQAREELERELGAVARIPEARLEVELVPLARKEFTLEKARVTLDGVPVAGATVERLRGPGRARVFAGPVPAGLHELGLELVYVCDFGALSYRTGYKYKLAQTVSLEAQRGLFQALEIRIVHDGRAPWEKQLSMAVARQEGMLTRLASRDLPKTLVDGPEPPAPLPRPDPEPPAAAEPEVVAAPPAEPAPVDPAGGAREQEPTATPRVAAAPAPRSAPAAKPEAVRPAAPAEAAAAPAVAPPAPAEPPTAPSPPGFRGDEGAGGEGGVVAPQASPDARQTASAARGVPRWLAWASIGLSLALAGLAAWGFTRR